MADHFYGVDKGDTEFDVTDDTSSPTKDVEVVIDLATIGTKSTDREKVLLALDMIKNHIMKNQWPPA